MTAYLYINKEDHSVTACCLIIVQLLMLLEQTSMLTLIFLTMAGCKLKNNFPGEYNVGVVVYSQMVNIMVNVIYRSMNGDHVIPLRGGGHPE